MQKTEIQDIEQIKVDKMAGTARVCLQKVFFKHALVHQQINEILRIDTQNIIIISQQFYNNKPEFLFLLSPSPNFFNWFVGLKYTEPSSSVIYKNAP